MKLSSVILAGGKNSRMEGVDKAFLLIEGQPLIEKLIEVLKSVFDEVVIVTNSPEKYSNLRGSAVRIITDIHKGLGPLGGIYSGLKVIRNEAAFFVACDMPNLNKELIIEQRDFFCQGLEHADCLIAKCNNKIQPLHAIYAKSTLKYFTEVISSGNLAVMGLVDRCKTVSFINFEPSHENCFMNLNLAADLKKLNESKTVNCHAGN